jgi:hypothetical protein
MAYSNNIGTDVHNLPYFITQKSDLYKKTKVSFVHKPNVVAYNGCDLNTAIVSEY